MKFHPTFPQLFVFAMLGIFGLALGQSTPTTTGDVNSSLIDKLSLQKMPALKTAKEAAADALDLIKTMRADTTFLGPGLHTAVATDLTLLENAANDVIKDDGTDPAATSALTDKLVAGINQNISRLNSTANRPKETDENKAKLVEWRERLTDIRVSFHPEPKTEAATTKPDSDDKTTATGRLQTCLTDLKLASAAIGKVSVANQSSFIEKTKADITLAQNDVTAALAYIAAHPELNTLKPGNVPADAPKYVAASIPSSTQSTPSKKTSPVQTTLDSLNAAMQSLIDEPNGDTLVPLLGEIDGRRSGIITDIHQAAIDLLAAVEFVRNRNASAPKPLQ